MPARLHHLERHRILRTGDPHLAGGVARQVEHEETVAAGPMDVEEKGVVRLEEDQRILDRVGADPVPVEPARPARLVQDDVEQRLGVVGPGRGGRGALDGLREQLAGGEVLHEDGERLRAAGVHGIGEQPVVGADLEGAHPEIVVSGRELVEVQQDLFRRAVGFQTATEDRVLPAGFGPVVVEPAVPRHRNREILLLDPAAQLLVEPLLKRLGAPHDRFGVPVLRLEIRQDLGSSRFLSQWYSSIRLSPWIVWTWGTERASGGVGSVPASWDCVSGVAYASVPPAGTDREGRVRLGLGDIAAYPEERGSRNWPVRRNYHRPNRQVK